MKEKDILVYQKMSNDLESIKDDNSVFRYFSKGKYRVLVDASQSKIPAITMKIKNNYPELAVVTIENNKMKCRSLGRYILSVDDVTMEVDHINRNVLDNRKSNLRVVSRSKQSLNRGRFNYSNTYKGVRKIKNGFKIEVCSNKSVHNLRLGGDYTEHEAAKIYDCIALKLNGLDHVLNFDVKYSEEFVNQTYSFHKDKITLNFKK